MQITLRINKEDKTFHTDFIPGLIYRKFLERRTQIDYTKVESYDEIVGFLVSAYDNQFTVDEFWKGIDSRNVEETILDFIAEMTGSKKAKKTGK